MDKLRKKVFWVIFLILTIFTTSVFAAYNVQQYNRERVETVRNFTQIERFDKDEKSKIFFESAEGYKSTPPRMPDEKDIMKNIRYMDNVVYTVYLDDDNSISEIVNHSSDETTDEEIEEIAKTILEEGRDR